MEWKSKQYKPSEFRYPIEPEPMALIKNDPSDLKAKSPADENWLLIKVETMFEVLFKTRMFPASEM